MAIAEEGSTVSHPPLKIPATAVIGPVTSMKIIPSEKIWIPDPEKYSMIACMGRFFAGL
jgi:hypothetical protein